MHKQCNLKNAAHNLTSCAQAALPEQANAVLVVPLHNGQQVLAVLQGQLADVHQALLIVGFQDGTPVAGHRGLFTLQGGVEAGIPQIGHRQRGHLHCRPTYKLFIVWQLAPDEI